jgi:phosphoglycerate kinase
MGGAKADDSLEVSKYVLANGVADFVLLGGVTGQLFLAAKVVNLGKDNMAFLAKKDLTKFTPGIKDLLEKYPDKIVLPVDLAIEVDGKRKEIDIAQLPTDSGVFDIGKKTVENFTAIINQAQSIVLSGPLGVYENPQFNYGTKTVFTAIAESHAFTLVGGGNTIAAINEYGLTDKISYISTAGGALIEFLMGKKLPGVAALETATQTKQIIEPMPA